ncbi:hypothetical protein [Caenispirillum salinarum]|uniref:hypothetical protein n=1 Tax=Caenispirillum salinarum TaxID=859058 RepID=UPI00384D19EB
MDAEAYRFSTKATGTASVSPPQLSAEREREILRGASAVAKQNENPAASDDDVPLGRIVLRDVLSAWRPLLALTIVGALIGAAWSALATEEYKVTQSLWLAEPDAISEAQRYQETLVEPMMADMFGESRPFTPTLSAAQTPQILRLTADATPEYVDTARDTLKKLGDAIVKAEQRVFDMGAIQREIAVANVVAELDTYARRISRAKDELAALDNRETRRLNFMDERIKALENSLKLQQENASAIARTALDAPGDAYAQIRGQPNAEAQQRSGELYMLLRRQTVQNQIELVNTMEARAEELRTALLALEYARRRIPENIDEDRDELFDIIAKAEAEQRDAELRHEQLLLQQDVPKAPTVLAASTDQVATSRFGVRVFTLALMAFMAGALIITARAAVHALLR